MANETASRRQFSELLAQRQFSELLAQRQFSELLAQRLLFLLPFAPRLDATHGGGRVMAHLLHRLAQRHDVALLYLQAHEEPPLDPHLQQACAFTVAVPRRSAPSRGISRWLRRAAVWGALLRGRPEWVFDWTSREFAHRLQQVAAAWQPHVVQLEYHLMGQYLPALAGCPAVRVLTEHEPGVLAAQEQLRPRQGLYKQFEELPWWRLRAALDLRAWQRYEAAVLRNVHAVVAFTAEDSRILRRLAGSTPVVTIPLAIPVPAAALDPLGAWPPQLLFVGNYAHPPNVDAALRLTDAIYPAVRARYAAAELLIVGDNPPPALLARHGAGVVVTGRVEDVRPYLDQAALVVAPLRQGGGMRVKVLEALAAGKALVASPLAVAGLKLTPGEHVVLAEGDDEFQAAIVRLLQAPQARAALASRAFAWAREQGDPRSHGERPVLMYERLYEALLRQHAAKAYL